MPVITIDSKGHELYWLWYILFAIVVAVPAQGQLLPLLPLHWSSFWRFFYMVEDRSPGAGLTGPGGRDDERRRGSTTRTGDGGEAADAGRSERARAKIGAAMESGKGAERSDTWRSRFPIRAVERNRRVAASVLAGGLAYRLFLWLLPFGLIVRRRPRPQQRERHRGAVEGGGVPAAISNAVGDASRAADSNSWWLFAVGVPLLSGQGSHRYQGGSARAFARLGRASLEAKPVGSVVFTGCSVRLSPPSRSARGSLTWRGTASAAALAIAPLTGLWLWFTSPSPQGRLPWRALCPGAVLIGIGVPLLKRTGRRLPRGRAREVDIALRWSQCRDDRLIFFVYLLGILVVSSPVLNSSLYDELRAKSEWA